MIRDYYTDRTLLITGFTGFVGQALTAKILRELGDEVRRIFVMIRPRRRSDGQHVQPVERLAEVYASRLFQGLAEADADAWARRRDKVVPVAIDERRADLGLSRQDRRRLQDEVDTIVNSAATVVFDEPLDVSLQANVGGPLALLELAQASSRRVDFVHVSTAYVSGRRTGSIPDEPLAVDRDMRQVIDGDGPGFDPQAEVEDCRRACARIYEEAEQEDFTRRVKREIVRQYRRANSRKLTRTRLEQLVEDRRQRWAQRHLVDEGMRRARERGWNDVYTFTKAMGEQMLMLRRGDVPLVIVRPSIIESSLRDPEPGWITGLKVMDPLVAAYGRGLVPDFPARKDIVLDLIPVDRVVNSTIAAATRARSEAVEVFQVATGTENPVRIGPLFKSVQAHYQKTPMRDRDGRAPDLPDWRYPSVRLFRTLFQLRYLYPIRFQEWLLDRPWHPPSPRRRRLLGTAKVRLQRVLYYVDIYHPYTHLDCRFETRRTRALFESLPADERAAFDMDVTGIDWHAYVTDVHLPGLRRHVLRDEGAPEAVLPEAPEEPGVEEERLQAEQEIPTLPDLVRWACARHAGNVAFEARGANGWQRITYAELLGRVEARAAAWQQLGLAAGDRVLLAGDNSPEWVIGYLAASFRGCTLVPVDPQTPADELQRLLAFTEARALVGSAAVLERLERAGQVPVTCIELDGGRVRGQAGAPLQPGAEPEITPEMTASVIFTSGTRVEPRGVMLSHANLIADLVALAEVQRVHDSDRILSLLPLHHGLEFTGGLLMSLWGGAATVYLDGPLNSRRILEAIRERRITAMIAVPRLLKILADRVHRLDTHTAPGSAPNADVLRSLRLIVSGGAPLGEALFDAYAQLGLTIHEGYGLTEAAPIVTVNPPGAARRGSVGIPLPGVELRIDAPAGGDGQILVAGPTVTEGYWKRPDLSAAVLRDGWLHTGDVGHLDADGYLTITGRIRDLIVTGAGKNVYPDEVEDLFAELPHVAELAVVGLPSTRTLGEEVHAVAVVDRPSRAADPRQVEEEIRAQVYERSRDLPPYQRVGRLHLRRRPLPRLDDGGVDRAALRQELTSGDQAPGDVDAADGLAPWERRLYQRVSELSGLAIGEVVAHAEAPLDTLIDSLMAAELAAFLLDAGAAEMPAIDRQRTCLRELVDRVGPAVTSRQGNGQADSATAAGDTPAGDAPAGDAPEAAADGQADSYWSLVLRRSPATRRGDGAGAAGAVAARLLQGALGIEALGLDRLPQGPFLLAADRPGAAAAAAVYAAVRPHLAGLCMLVEREETLGGRWESWLVRCMAQRVVLSDRRSLQEALADAASRVGPRRPLLLFPEGARRTRTPAAFKTGIGLLALELDVPVIPVRVELAGAPTDPSSSPRGARVHAGTAIDPESFRAQLGRLTPYEVYREIAEAVRRQLHGPDRSFGDRAADSAPMPPPASSQPVA